MRNEIFATFNGVRKIISRKTGEIYEVIVLRDYESFTELELWPKRDGYILDDDVVLGDDVVVEGIMNSKGITNVARVRKSTAKDKAS